MIKLETCTTEGYDSADFSLFRAMENSLKGIPHNRRYAVWDPSLTTLCPLSDEAYLEFTRSDKCPVYVIEHVWESPVVFTSFHELAAVSDHVDEKCAWAFVTNAILKGNIKRYKNLICKLADWRGDRRDLVVAGDAEQLERARFKKPYLLGVERTGEMTIYLDGQRKVPDMEESAVLKALKNETPTRWGRRYFAFATIGAMAKFLSERYPNDKSVYRILKVGENPMTCDFRVRSNAGEIFENDYAHISFFNFR